MYEQNQNPWGNQQQTPPPKPYKRDAASLLALAAFICAVLGLATTCCIYGGFIFGALAVILALLSRGNRKKTTGMAKPALFIGIAAILASVVITIASFTVIFAQYGSIQNFMDSYTYTLENTYGIDLFSE